MAINKPKIQVQVDIPSSIKQVNADLSQLEKQLKPINVSLNINSNSINGVQQSTAKITKSTQDLSLQLDNIKNKAIGAYGGLIKYTQQNQQAAEKLSPQLKEIGNLYTKLQNETDFSKARSEYSQLTSSVTAFKGAAREANLEGRTLGQEIENSLKKFSSWIGIGTVVMTAVNAVKQMADNVRDLDKAMTNIQIASGATNSEAQKMMSTYTQMGKELGATTIEVADSADAFLRQGKSISDTNELIKDSMMLSKLGEIDSADATQYLTSAMKGYGVSVKDTVNIVDQLTKVDQISATSAGGLAEAMSKTANVANISGVSMQKLIGYLAVVGETTQKSMDEVGTSFQAIFSRMGNVKAGKFVDDQTGEALNDVETVLNKVGIKLRDNQGQFRNFGTVLDEIAAKWKSYDSVQQNAITTAVAGTRQRENLTVLLNQYSTATKYSEAATNSAGTATEKMTVYQNSLEAKTKAATAAFEELSKVIINGDIFKGAIDSGKTFSDILTSIVKSGAGIPALITSISAGMSIAGKNAGKEYAHLLKVA